MLPVTRNVDIFSKKARSKIMSAIRSKHTSPEIAFRKALRSRRIAYRLHYGKEKIDIAIPSKKLAIFIDGCFWHGCPRHSSKPKTNRAYWLPKLRKNKLRDKAKTAKLKAAGWKVMRFWEHDVKKRLEWCIEKVVKRAQWDLSGYFWRAF